MTMAADSKHKHPGTRGMRTWTWRKLWLDVHLYLGLSVGAFLVIVGLTGSILVFFHEIDGWLNPELHQIQVSRHTGMTHQPLANIMQSALQAAPADSTVTTVYGPRRGDGVYAIYTSQDSGDWQRIFVDPYRAQVTGVRSYAADQWVPDHLIDFLFQLHFSLLLGANGIAVVAIIALMLIISLITGLILWWPTTGQWRKALTIKRHAGPVRFNFDLHKALSFYLLPLLLALLLSGVYMNLHEPFVWVTRQFSPETRLSLDQLTSSPIGAIRPIPVESAWAIAVDQFPQGELHAIYLPDDEMGVFVVVQKHVPGLSKFWSERQIAIDQYSGEILDVRAPDTRRSVGETFLDWLWPLHSGEAFGWTGRIAVFLCGLACPVIYVTGVIRWLQKRRKPQARMGKSSSTATIDKQTEGAL